MQVLNNFIVVIVTGINVVNYGREPVYRRVFVVHGKVK